MSQNSRNPANEGQGNSGRTDNSSPRSNERMHLDGFEGMNYEQRRGPYNPHRNGEGERGDMDGASSSANRRDDL
jgi:hypothetical protein